MKSSVRLLLCLVFVFGIISSAAAARNSMAISVDEPVFRSVGIRSLKVNTNDYGDPSANRGHDPPSSRRGGGGGRRV